MGKIRLEFEFDMYEECEEFHIFSNTRAAYSLINELDDKLRQTCKHGDLEDDVLDLLQEIRDMISESGVLYIN